MTHSAFDLAQLWAQSDTITHLVAVTLILMSALSWTVMVTKALMIWRLQKVAGEVKGFWHATRFDAALASLSPAQNPFLELAQTGQEASQHHSDKQDELHGVLNLSDWVSSCLRQSIEETTGRLQAGLSILASVGSTAPFIGLFGTVWGIYHALVSISQSGDVGIDKVAGPVGESLVMTALGLAVAIPAVLGYNALVRGNKDILAKLKHFAHALHAYLITGKPVTSSTKRGA